MSRAEQGVPAGPLDLVPLLLPERALLLDLLTSLAPAAWDRPTECPAWTVTGIALHVLGDDLSLLARQRDAATPSIPIEPTLPAWNDAPENLLDRFNQRWVHAATFMSPALIVEQLAATGAATHAWYSSVDPASRGEIVMLFGAEPAPYWAITAREYLERWVHHLQIRRAIDLGPGALDDTPYLPAAWQVVARALPQLLDALTLPASATVAVRMGADLASYAADADGRWRLLADAVPEPTVEITVAREDATRLLSRAMRRDEARAAMTVSGDPEFGAPVHAAIAAVFAP